MPDDGALEAEEARTEIRFGLSQLGARDAHHEFEHLARGLARMTVSLNILPATGPVAGGGDQGRDAETYRTDFPGQVAALGRQLGIADSDGLAFACTLQQADVLGKLAADIEKIISDGSEVQWVVAYCEANVKVGDRHRFQKRMKDEHGVHVEVFDGNGISELLSQRHLYWIARQHLHLSERTLPTEVERPGWYEQSLQRWQGRTGTKSPRTMADFVDVKTCLRLATSLEDARRDLPFWLDLAERGFADDTLPDERRMGAAYDIARANLRGLGDLRPAEDKVRTFVEYALGSAEPSVLLDAAVLVVYGGSARVRGLTDLSEDLVRWGDALLGRVNLLLEASTSPGQSCALLDLKAFLQLRPDFASIEGREDDYDISPDHPHWSAEEWNKALRLGEAIRLDIPLVDLDGGLDSLVTLAEALPSAPLYPIRHIADLLSLNAPVLADDPRFETIIDIVDGRLAEVEGNAAAARAAQGRAMQFFNDGRLFLALRDLHKARSGWFSGDYARGVVLACLMTAECYHRLHLPAAAKYFALVAMHVVRREDNDLLPSGMFSAARADYHQGAWFAAVEAYELAMTGHEHLTHDPDDWVKHSEMQQAVAALTIIAALARQAGEPYESFVFAALERRALGDLPSEVAADLDGPAWWDAMSASEVFEHAAADLGVPVFSDGGQRRTIWWSALGVTWSVSFQNEYEGMIVGERVAAMMQVMTADIAGRDPALVPTRVRVEIETSPPGSAIVVEQPISDGSGSTVRATFPRLVEPSGEAFDDIASGVLELMAVCVAETTVLDQEAFQAVFAQAMEDDLKSKILFGTAYDIACRAFVAEDLFTLAPRANACPLPGGHRPEPLTGEGMAMPSAPGPGFSARENEALIGRRYDQMMGTLPVTFAALRCDPDFHRTITELRAEGWLDWHILLEVFNLAQNRRYPVTRGPEDEDEARRLTQMMLAPESADADPLAVGEFTAGALRSLLPLGQMTILNNVARLPMQNPPDIDAVRRMVVTRYGFNTDVDHDDPFLPDGA